MKLLSGKTALITGASRGIGAATAKLFGKHGANVAVNYLKYRRCRSCANRTMRQ